MWITLTVRAEHGRAHRAQQGPRDRHQHERVILDHLLLPWGAREGNDDGIVDDDNDSPPP